MEFNSQKYVKITLRIAHFISTGETVNIFFFFSFLIQFTFISIVLWKVMLHQIIIISVKF